MKILWVKSDFLHPTTKGGHIRTLGILKQLHARHEIHYAALDLADQPGGFDRSSEYSTQAYPVPHRAPPHVSPRFWLQAAGNLLSELPLSVARYTSDAMKRQVSELIAFEKFDAIVCDFLFAAPYFPDLGRVTLFQHNVEAQILRRRIEYASNAIERKFLHNQHEKLRRYEREVCRAVKRIIAVSEEDAETMRGEYGAPDVRSIPTGVDIDYFRPPQEVERSQNLVFVGSMDWAPNVDGIEWFVGDILPRIRQRLPDCLFTIAGRLPGASIRKIAQEYHHIRVTGTVDDVRPYLWESAVSVVPLRVGGGTRLKIFEAMAARIPVVSTTIGAEGLAVSNGDNIRIADTPEDFADRCMELLADPAARCRLASSAWEMVAACYSWEVVSRRFEECLT
ncbi:MAG TPA: glycosyltransferase [Bryobacteraceae bacterium]|nr:glycosyltransferase [Bryobacteraceae bacterium]